jgi:2,3-bisphosphoglycerate-independent phosphoglycerate mutase
MVDYSKEHNAYMPPPFPKREIVNTLGSWVAQHGLRQFRLAETEKYPHVTFFLNGGKETARERRRPLHGPVAQGGDLRSAARDERGEVTDHLVEGHRGRL